MYKYNRLHAGALDQERTRILFFLFGDLMEKNIETGRARRRVDLLPLFTWHRDFDGNRRLQIFAPIEPVLPGSGGLERNWSPLVVLVAGGGQSRDRRDEPIVALEFISL